MRQLIWFAVLIFSTAAFGQSQSSTDIICTPLEHLHETACSLGDGTGEIVTDSYIHHYTAEEWDRMFPILIKADDDAKADSDRKIAEAQAQEIAAEKALAVLKEKAHSIHHKKDCTAAGFKWAYGACWLTDEVSPEAK